MYALVAAAARRVRGYGGLSVKRLRPAGLFWGWYIALAGAGCNFLVIGVATFGFGVFVTPMREELG